MTDKGIEVVYISKDIRAYLLESVEDVEVFSRHHPSVALPKGWTTLVVVLYYANGEEFIIDIKSDEVAEDFIARNRSTDGALQSANKVRAHNGLALLSPATFIAYLNEDGYSMDGYLAAANNERRVNGEPEYTMEEFIASRRGAVRLNVEKLEGCFPQPDHGFGKALEALSHGKRVARRGWNGKEMFVESVSGAEAKLANGCTVALEAFFVLRSPNGRYNTWVPSVSDLMAHDWYEL